MRTLESLQRQAFKLNKDVKTTEWPAQRADLWRCRLPPVGPALGHPLHLLPSTSGATITHAGRGFSRSLNMQNHICGGISSQGQPGRGKLRYAVWKTWEASWPGGVMEQQLQNLLLRPSTHLQVDAMLHYSGRGGRRIPHTLGRPMHTIAQAACTGPALACVAVNRCCHSVVAQPQLTSWKKACKPKG